VDLRAVQGPLKDRYRNAPEQSKITLRAHGSRQDTPTSCSVDIGRAVYRAQAHSGVGGSGTAACSGDLLLGALAACAQITCQMVAAAMGIELQQVEVTTEGDLDLRGTLGIAGDVPVGFEEIRVRFTLDAPRASRSELELLRHKSEQYCVVMQTLTSPPPIQTSWLEGTQAV
jgi:uncharacterized OsmC-like protein